jgi:ABC-type transport system involved in multi-copper enzyme maturation permease subunit
MRALLTIARMEFTAASRLWWIRLFTIAYALMTVAMSQAATVSGDATAGESFARLTVALLPLALMVVPLASLLVGVSSVPGDPDASGFLLTLPISPGTALFGRWVGQAGAMAAALVAGYGAGALVVWAGTVATDVVAFLTLVGACLLLALAFLSIAALLAAVAPNRGAALGIATFVWFAAVIFYDAAALAGALWLTGRAGTRLLFGSVFANVVDLVRILTLSLAGTPHILGVAGESWVRTLGGPVPVVALASFALGAWIVVPLAVAVRVTALRDL